MSEIESRPMFARSRHQIDIWAVPCIAAFGAILFASPIGTRTGVPFWFVELAGLIVGACSLYAMSRPFKCPGCRTNLMFFVMLKGPIGNWLEAVIALRSCPKCGFDGQDSPPQSGRSRSSP